MEVLSDVLRSLRVTGSVYFCDHMEPPWSLEFDDPGQASFHLLRRGECWLQVDEEKDHLGPGDFVFVGPGVRHALIGRRPVTGTPVATLLLCGYCRFDRLIAHPLVKALPRQKVIRDEELMKHTGLKGTLDHLSTEYMAHGPGSEVIVDKLTEVLLVELLRIDFGRGENLGFATALADKHIGPALESIHEKPDESWTLERLAKRAALSRAAFAKRFKKLVGETMFDYLTCIRVQRAQTLLRDTGLPIYDIANKVGYRSDLAFTKTFKKLTGMTPTVFRKHN